MIRRKGRGVKAAWTSGCVAFGCQHAAVDFEAVGQQVLGRKLREVFGHLHLVRSVAQEQFDVLMLLGRAKDEAHRLVLALAPVVLLEPREIQVHLPFVGCDERPNLEVNGHEAAQATMVEQQVEPVVVVVNPHGELPGHETEIAAEFGEELLEIGEDGGFEVFLGIRAFEAEEVEQVRVFEGVLVAHRLDGAALLFKADEGFGVA